jgi:hypothetical protein
MKILSPSMDPGTDPAGQAGVPIHIRSFVRALVDLGIQVTLVSSAATSEQSVNADSGALVRLVRLESWNHAVARGLRDGSTVRGLLH